MLVIACYFVNGHGVMPGADALAKKLVLMLQTEGVQDAETLAGKLSKMLVGEMGMFIVYSTEPPSVAPTDPPVVIIPVTPGPGIPVIVGPQPQTWYVERKPDLAVLDYYATAAAPQWFKQVHTTWAMRVWERTGPPNDRLKVNVSPEIWIRTEQVKTVGAGT